LLAPGWTCHRSPDLDEESTELVLASLEFASQEAGANLVVGEAFAEAVVREREALKSGHLPSWLEVRRTQRYYW
jgi:hypothetical protein